jgi:hypothetical protein
LRTRQIKLAHLILGTLLVYVTVHLLEEWWFGFPAWAEARWGIPGYTVVKWLLHNVYFAAFLAAGYILYRINPDRFLFAGLGIVVWGVLNSVNHIAFTIIFLEYSPGLFTGLVFVILAVLAYQRVREMDRLSWKTVVPSILAGLFYWGAPIVLFITVDGILGI